MSTKGELIHFYLHNWQLESIPNSYSRAPRFYFSFRYQVFTSRLKFSLLFELSVDSGIVFPDKGPINSRDVSDILIGFINKLAYSF